MERFRQRYGIALTKKKLQEIILMLMAWEAVFAFSYLGYIELPAISTTTLHILVIVAAMMLGAQGSVPVVCVFVVTSMWIGTYSLSQLDRVFSPFASGMPLGSKMLVFARVLFAAGAGWLFDLYFRKPQVCLSGHCGDCGCQHPSSWAVRFCRVILQFPNRSAASGFRTLALPEDSRIAATICFSPTSESEPNGCRSRR